MMIRLIRATSICTGFVGKYGLNKKKYIELFPHYLKRQLNNIYRLIIALHGRYDYFDAINSRQINEPLGKIYTRG